MMFNFVTQIIIRIFLDFLTRAFILLAQPFGASQHKLSPVLSDILISFARYERVPCVRGQALGFRQPQLFANDVGS